MFACLNERLFWKIFEQTTFKKFHMYLKCRQSYAEESFRRNNQQWKFNSVIQENQYFLFARLFYNSITTAKQNLTLKT